MEESGRGRPGEGMPVRGSRQGDPGAGHPRPGPAPGGPGSAFPERPPTPPRRRGSPAPPRPPGAASPPPLKGAGRAGGTHCRLPLSRCRGGVAVPGPCAARSWRSWSLLSPSSGPPLVPRVPSRHRTKPGHGPAWGRPRGEPRYGRTRTRRTGMGWDGLGQGWTKMDRDIPDRGGPGRAGMGRAKDGQGWMGTHRTGTGRD